jgi:hypothetical protein
MRYHKSRFLRAGRRVTSGCHDTHRVQVYHRTTNLMCHRRFAEIEPQITLYLIHSTRLGGVRLRGSRSDPQGIISIIKNHSRVNEVVISISVLAISTILLPGGGAFRV